MRCLLWNGEPWHVTEQEQVTGTETSPIPQPSAAEIHTVFRTMTMTIYLPILEINALVCSYRSQLFFR